MQGLQRLERNGSRAHAQGMGAWMRFLVILTATLIAGCGSGGSAGGGNAGSGSPPSVGATTTSGFGTCAPPSASLSPAGSVGALVDGLAATEMKQQQLPGMAVALAKAGSLVYAQGYGYADLSDCRPVQPDTPFQLASDSKAFTAAAILQLQSAGALDIDNPVITYLPEYPFDPRITVRMLLNQISGLADYLNDAAVFPNEDIWLAQGVTEQTALTAIAQAALQFEPGTQYQYSNSNYFLLGSILEAVSPEAYPDYLAAHIFGPLGLTHTSYTQPPAAALPYEFLAQVGPVQAPIWARSDLFAAGALWSDVQDLASFDAALFNGKLLPAAQFTEMVTPPPNVVTNYAMGWMKTTVLNRPFVWHEGGLPGALSYNGFFLDDGFSISLLMNESSIDIVSFSEQMVEAVCGSSPTAC
jgi:D-alanyl-D-alanine carboxypeptidase